MAALSAVVILMGVAGLTIAIEYAAAETQAKAEPAATIRSKAASPWANKLGAALKIAAQPVELLITAVSDRVVRISLVPIEPDGAPVSLTDAPVLELHNSPAPAVRLRGLPRSPSVARLGSLQVSVSPDPLTISLRDASGQPVQEIQINQETGEVDFGLGDGPVLGLGEGGHQFDRRGSVYPMRSGQDVPDLLNDGTRVPIPWLVGSSNRASWALFFHLPLGSFDLTGNKAGNRGRFNPWTAAAALPMDVFVVAGHEPSQLLEAYAGLTGHPQMPPLWSLGYQQSHRTLSSREEILSEARTFRQKKLPCDLLIYLGTGFCPSGWNIGHGSFDFNPKAFPDPANMIRELHGEHFRVAVHIVGPPLDLYGTAADKGLTAEDPNDAASYWSRHFGLIRMGIDGFWPDEGDPLGIEARLARNRMYWEGPQIERPNQRPYALHRNGYAGVQRYGWLWSGDVESKWATLRAQVPVGINTGLTGMPFWGTDTGGFIPTPEFTGELYVRWFQFSAFCPLFRSHGRAWKLRLPWGWDTGDYGPTEVDSPAQLPGQSELHNGQVEPICRRYLDLRYRLLPYTYSAVHESYEMGLPLVRALWLYYSNDARAGARGDEYLWGRDILVAPVTERGADLRPLYLPRGQWFDFWTNKKEEGGREIRRAVDLSTLPLYVRAGAIIPMGPVKQYADEKVPAVLSLIVYPGAGGSFVLYEDDGETFNYLKGQFMKLRLEWDDARRRLSLRLEPGSKMLPPLERRIEVRIPPENLTRSLIFVGKSATAQF